MSFHRLPSEILTEIFQDVALLDGSGSRDTKADGLVNLSLCSQWVHDLVEPILYSAYKESTRLTLLGFLRTVLDYPHLAERVKAFTGQDRGTRSIADPPAHPVEGYESWDFKSTIRPALNRVDDDEVTADTWSRTIYQEDWDATTALTLICLPQLRHLHLDLAGLQERVVLEGGGLFQDIVEFQPMYYGWIHHVLRWAAQLQSQPTAPQALQYLTSVTIRTFDQNGRGLAFNDLVPFLQLKSVRTLRLEDCHLKQCTLSSPLSLSTTEISLWNCSITPDQLLAFLSSFPKLQKLHHQHFSITKLFEPNNIAAALTSSPRPSLKELVLLDPSDFCSGKLEGWPMSSFAPLRNLEILDCVAFDQWVERAWDPELADFSSDLRPMYDLLPRSLKSLTLRQATRETLLHVMGLLEFKTLRPPQLGRVKLVFGEDFYVEGVGKEVRDLAGRCGKCGVGLVVEVGRDRVDIWALGEEGKKGDGEGDRMEEDVRGAWAVYNGY